MLRGLRLGERRRALDEVRFAPAFEFESQVLNGHEQVAAQEFRAEEFSYQADALFDRVVLYHVSRLMPVEEREARALLERDGADVQVLQVRVLAARLGERELGEAAPGDALFERRDELI